MFGVKGGIPFITPFELCGPFCVEESEAQVVLHAFFGLVIKYPYCSSRELKSGLLRTFLRLTRCTPMHCLDSFFFPVDRRRAKPRLPSLCDHPTGVLPPASRITSRRCWVSQHLPLPCVCVCSLTARWQPAHGWDYAI